ncbi:MAG: hypothetical protein VZR27_08320 [Acutalibacteraceae bacterium]|nr:hypothetical protein [Acutalibacteraceae bacterium]
MAFKDANGKITIDDEAAAKDVKNLTDAIEHFDVVLSMINQMEMMTAGFKGNSLMALTESYEVLRTEINTMKQESSDTVDMINHVVEKYHQIDRELKDLIMGQQS